MASLFCCRETYRKQAQAYGLKCFTRGRASVTSCWLSLVYLFPLIGICSVHWLRTLSPSSIPIHSLYCITPSLHHTLTASLPQCITLLTASLLTASHPHCITLLTTSLLTPSHPHCITASLHHSFINNITSLPSVNEICLPLYLYERPS